MKSHLWFQIANIFPISHLARHTYHQEQDTQVDEHTKLAPSPLTQYQGRRIRGGGAEVAALKNLGGAKPYICPSI